MPKLCPGKSKYVKDQSELGETEFRRLVQYRAKRLLKPSVRLSTEGQRKEAEKNLEKVHLEPDFLPAAFLTLGSARANAVCRMRTRTSLGTGFLVARGFLMTNNHVIGSQAEAEGSVAEFDFEKGVAPRVVTLQPARLFLTDEALDFTIVACDDAPLSDIEPIRLLRNPQTVTRHERVNIIQHPSGRPKEIAIHDNRVTRIRTNVILYTTDTEPGSSGSPVFTNEWDLVALHHAGEKLPGGGAENEGIRIAAIVAHLLNRSTAEVSSEGLQEVLSTVTDTSPFLGFFDFHGVAEPGSLEIEVPDFRGAADFADVGVWNIEHFNDTVPDQRVNDVADVLENLSMDAMGLTEVQAGAMERLTGELNARGGNTGFVSLNVAGRQDLAVLFDRNTTKVKLLTDLADRYREQLEARTADGKTAFPRPPLFAECVVQDDNENDVRFVMALVHLKAFGDAQSRARRRLASEKLAEIVADLRGRGHSVVLGGDFNERLDTNVLQDLKDSPDLFSMTADDASGDAISYVGASHRSLIDHILVSNDVELGEISGDDAAIVRLDKSVRDFADRVSDHVPVVFRMVMRDEPIPLPGAGNGEKIEIPIPEDAAAVHVTFASE